MKTDALIVARDNAYGLTVDTHILMSALAEAGLAVATATPRARPLIERILNRKRAHYIFHIERAFPRWFGAGEMNVLIPNPERFPESHIARLGGIDLVLAKTQHARGIFEGLGKTTLHSGFASPDRFRPDVARDWGAFLHIAGRSTEKGTEDVVAAWRDHPHWPELILIQHPAAVKGPMPANIRLLSGFMDDDALLTLQNRCGIHLCPSHSEGWGHYILEAMSTGAVVVTTDAAPMNEHVTAETGFLVAATRHVPRHLGTSHFPDRDSLAGVVETLIGLPDADKAALGRRARAAAEAKARAFRAAIRDRFGR